MKTPQHPRIIFRIGFTGNRDTGENIVFVQQALEKVFKNLDVTINKLHTNREGVQQFYDNNTPILRLISGLAEGWDAIASNTFLKHPATNCENKIAAILGCETMDYRNYCSTSHHHVFEELLKQCEYVISLDGKLEADIPKSITRAKLFRSQAAIILRNSDMLIAVADPNLEGKAGGSIETIKESIRLGIPVIFINANNANTQLILPGDDVATLLDLSKGTIDPEAYIFNLNKVVMSLIADPNMDPNSIHGGSKKLKDGHEVLHEYFDQPFEQKTPAPKWSYRILLWKNFEKRFKPKTKSGDTVIEHSIKNTLGFSNIATFRERATKLNRLYSGNYRGAFLLNFLLALLAVVLATISLWLIGEGHSELGNIFSKIIPTSGIQSDSNSVAINSQHIEAPHLENNTISTSDGLEHTQHSINWLILVLAVIKLICVVFIYYNTRRVHKGKWTEKAVDYRYLAERLRSMFYLPATGNFRPPSATLPQFASRVVRQSNIDWLFNAIVRSISPAQFATKEIYKGLNGDFEINVIRIDNATTCEYLREDWVEKQAKYHQQNELIMENMNSFLSKFGSNLNFIVIVIVALDILIALSPAFSNIPADLSQRLHALSPVFMAIAAILPAAVAGLNGIRFQSECQRLAERSGIMSVLLGGRKMRDSENADSLNTELTGRIGDLNNWLLQQKQSKLGSGNVELMHLAEAIANDMVQEVAEWSVLYAKELVEP